MLGDIVALVQHEGVEEVGRLDPRWGHPVRDVVHDAGNNLGEVMVHQLATAQVWGFNCNGRIVNGMGENKYYYISLLLMVFIIL